MREETPAVTTLLRIAGRVQGVGYRDALRAEALRLGVAGWVRNRRDGTVEALLHGAPHAVEALRAWARRGPAAAQVSSVESTPAPAGMGAAPQGFRRMPTE